MGAQFLYSLIKPRSMNEDDKRREFIINVLLLGSLFISLAALINLVIYKSLLGSAYRGLSPFFLFIIFLVFLSLYTISRKGHYLTSSYIFLFVWYIPTVYVAYLWGADLPASLLFFVLIIVMSGILINTRLAFFVTVGTSLVVVFIAELHIKGVIKPNLYWRNELLRMSDMTVYVITFFIIMTVSWLSNREIEKSLQRARRSEADLKKERDNLELTIEERTKELKKVQMEKISQLYRFAEFGKLSSGLFHDLVNPLTAVTLSLEQARLGESNGVDAAKLHLKKAVQSTKKIENFIMTVRKQVQKQETSTYFSLTEEVIQSAQMFSYKARKLNVKLCLSRLKKVKTFGDQIKFSQVISNLISNSIDSYENIDGNHRDRRVEIRLWKEGDNVFLSVEDWGSGISEDDLTRIFEPFFTTKVFEKGTGIGLSSTKDIIEVEFRGGIDVNSKLGKGTKFKVWFPLRSLKDNI